MKKVYTIGRDASCDVVIPDKSDVVSRVHASLKVKGPGKYVIVDQGRNGTYVNGIKMSPNEEVPVTRKDQISFAHVADLDWEQIPKEKPQKLIWGSVAAVAVVLIGVGLFLFLRPDAVPAAAPAAADSNSIATTLSDTTGKKEAEVAARKPIVKDKATRKSPKPAAKKESSSPKAAPAKAQPKTQPKPEPKAHPNTAKPKKEPAHESKKPGEKGEKSKPKPMIF